ncbi:MAG: mitochondrial fission ELM1 family protein [Synergistaceae bacterium]|jgi:mitochondrial fission protein ELM1|nr:mitochondrial fission ELM1 family protein [Synergistaceae bacterium]
MSSDDVKRRIKRRRAYEDDRDDPVVRVSRREAPSSPGLKLVVILSDGIRGHVNQSRGVAAWLSRRTGAEILELGIPEPKGIKRRKARAAASKLLEGNRRKARDWLSLAEGESVIRTLGRWLLERGIREGDAESLILLSAGTMCAFYNIALGYIWRCTCVTVMTPSVIGTAPFDFAIVPEHDCPRDVSNVMTTVGAPNLIVREDLGPVGESLLREFPPSRERRWGLLIGGDDRNYRISAAWIHKQAGKIFQEAMRGGVDLYIATSGRTSAEAESALRRIAANSPNVRFLMIAREDPLNPVPAMLGACDEIFVTDDSVDTVSEAVTAGHRAILLRAERVGAIKNRLQGATSLLVSSGLLPRKALWGVSRFDQTFKRFMRMGLLVDFKGWLRERRRDEFSPFAPLGGQIDMDFDGFNEARRAADWILDNLGAVPRSNGRGEGGWDGKHWHHAPFE